MKQTLKISIVMAAFAIAIFSCKKTEEKPEPKPEPKVPVITITTQPTATTTVTVGSITGSLTVAATATESATLSYQWNTATNTSHAGAAPISGATNASFTIPTTLAAGTYYYFCEVKATGADTKRSNVATVIVNAKPAEEQKEVILEALDDNDDLSEFCAALKELDLGGVLSDDLTVFALKNSAAKSKAADDEFDIMRHIVSGNYPKSSLTNGMQLTALDGSILYFTIEGEDVFVNGVELGEEITVDNNTVFIVEQAIPVYIPPVVTKTLVSIAVTTQPNNLTYTVGQSFNVAGMVVTATYSDNTTAPVTVTAGMLSYDFSSTGTKTVTISYTYEGVTKTATVTVTVVAVGTVSITIVGAQSGPVAGGAVGSATYIANTTGIDNGSYPLTVAWFTNSEGAAPTGAPQGIGIVTPLVVSGNVATITVNHNANIAAAGNYYFKIIISTPQGNVESNVATLVVSPPRSVSITGEQSAQLTAGSEGTTTFTVTTANIDNGKTGEVLWFDVTNGQPASAPTGLSAAVSAVSSNQATVTMTATNQIAAGFYYFRVEIDGVMSAMPFAAVAVYEPGTVQFYVGGIYYKLISGSTDEVEVTNKLYTDIGGPSSSNSYSGSVTVPATVTYNTTYTVKRIGIDAFTGSQTLTSVSLPSGIEAIGNWAFSGCQQLASLNIPASVTSIGINVFVGCGNLGLTVQAGGVFSLNNGVLFESNEGNPIYYLRWISPKVNGISGQFSLTEYYIPYGVVSIGQSAINGAPLYKLSIPATVTSISVVNFSSCQSLGEFELYWANPEECEMGAANQYFVSITPKPLIILSVPAGSKANYVNHPIWGTVNGFDANNIIER